jgi:hypothetical protein
MPEGQQPCRWCGETHGPLCSIVKALDFAFGDYRVTRVEFLTAADFAGKKSPEDEPISYPRLKPIAGA